MEKFKRSLVKNKIDLKPETNSVRVNNLISEMLQTAIVEKYNADFKKEKSIPPEFRESEGRFIRMLFKSNKMQELFVNFRNRLDDIL